MGYVSRRQCGQCCDQECIQFSPMVSGISLLAVLIALIVGLKSINYNPKKRKDSQPGYSTEELIQRYILIKRGATENDFALLDKKDSLEA